jgi:hypothetical protein
MPTIFITSSADSHDLVIFTPLSVSSSTPSCAAYHCDVRQLSDSASSTQLGTYVNCPSLEILSISLVHHRQRPGTDVLLVSTWTTAIIVSLMSLVLSKESQV